jgi:hypothetical protein
MIEAFQRAHVSPNGVRPWIPGAVIEGRTGASQSNGAVLVLTPAGALAVRGLPTLPAGTLVTLKLPQHPSEPVSLLGARAPASPAAANMDAAGSLEEFESPLLLKRWPAFAEALAQAPAAAARAATGPDPTLPARVLEAQRASADGPTRGLSLLIDALAHGGHAELAGKLLADFVVLARLTENAEPENWSLALVPFVAGGAVQQMRVFTEKNRKPDDGARFAVELDESPYGPLRIEGIVRGERIDLSLACEGVLPKELATTLRATCSRVLIHTGHSGSLAIISPKAIHTLARPHTGPGLLA